ncbi:hypothetical protein Mx8p69 [Myxococcus phage Mx8]|uniref:p69 n=1 Tax=Myxococcus phage Mx8 TaxID=49964 RepID=Q94MQ0_9CAUD|nr:hypothetical protein Mx8p69 [Myxococcus phage Mx8]AAK94404.1 p69 [Myxococcus phage Mx8]
MQKPSVGRVVHYQGADDPPRAAIVTATYPENDPASTTARFPYGPDYVDLCVFNPDGTSFARAVKFSESPDLGCWSWPPRV